MVKQMFEDYWYEDECPVSYGSAYQVNDLDPDYDAVDALRGVVAEITGIPQKKRRIGFY